MSFLQFIILCSILFAYGDGFLTQTISSNSQIGSPSNSQLQQALIFVSGSLSEEKKLRKQLELIVNPMVQDMAKLKQLGTTGLLDNLMSLNQSVDYLNKENQALKHENENLTLALNDLKQDISAMKQQEASLKLEINSLNVKEATCRCDVDSLITNITSYPGKEQSQGVGFTVSFSSYASRSGIMKFDRIKSNYGNVYNRTSGTFVCNKSGLYIFVLSIRSNTRDAFASILINNQYMTWAFVSNDDDNNAWDSATTSVVIQLNAGDEVSAESGGLYYYNENTFFSGALISAN